MWHSVTDTRETWSNWTHTQKSLLQWSFYGVKTRCHYNTVFLFVQGTLARPAQCEENCASSKGRKEEHEDAPSRMRSRTEWELAAQLVSFQKKQNSKITAPTHAAPSEILNHSNRFCSLSEGHSLFVCFKPRAKVVPLAKALVEIHHLPNHQWHFTHLCICPSTDFSEHCVQALSAKTDSVLLRWSLGPS